MRTVLTKRPLLAIKILLLLSCPFVAMWIPTVTAPGKPTIIVAGEVKSITSKTEGNLIYSYVTFHVMRVRNGSSSLKDTEIIIRHAGGQSGGIVLWQSDQPYFFVGEKAQVEVEPEDQVYKVVGGHKGKKQVDQNLQPITLRTAAGYRLIWFRPPSDYQYSTTRPGPDWYGPLKWSTSSYEYWINTQGIPPDLSVSSFITYATASFQSWQDDPGSSFVFTYRGTRTDVLPEAQDGVNLAGWGVIGGDTIARVSFWGIYSPGDYDSLRFTETDMKFDSSKSWSAEPSGVTGRFDVQNIGTHEAGHTFGLADLYDSEDSEQTMYGYAATAETKKRTLEWGDLAGIRYLYPSPLVVPITVTSSPTGSGFVTVDDVPITTPQVFMWLKESSHTLAANSPVSGGTGIQYLWLSWSDGGAQSHTIVTPASATTYTANFKKQYMLTTSVSPTGGGIVSVSSGWRDEGVTVPVTATPNTGYSFYYWNLDGANVGSNPSYSVLMNSPHSLTAIFRGTSSITLGLSAGSIPIGASVTLQGTITPTQPSPGIPIGTNVDLSYTLNGGSWSIFITTKTSSGAAYSVAWYPPYPCAYQIKASWNGNGDYEGSTSSTASLTVTGTFPPRTTLLITGPTSAPRGSSATFTVIVTNPGPSLSTTLYLEVKGPAGYVHFDLQQITVPASGRESFQFLWQIPSAATTGEYQVSAGLIPPKPTAIVQTRITIT